MRLVMAPDRNMVSRAAVSSTWSATSVIGDHGKLVMATVTAPPRRASRSASMVSTVVPVRVGPGERGPPDALQLVLEVLAHVAAGADPVDVDPGGGGQRVDNVDNHSRVPVVRGVGDRGGVGV